MRLADAASVAVRAGRRGVIAALILLAFRSPSHAEAPVVSFADWVNTLYVGTAILRDAGGNLSEQEMRGLFTPEIQALRAAKNQAQPPSEPAGPMLQLLFGWGALPNSRIEILSVKAIDKDKATVDLTANGLARRLILTGLYNEPAKAWQIDDIDYGEGGPDRTLRDRLEK